MLCTKCGEPIPFDYDNLCDDCYDGDEAEEEEYEAPPDPHNYAVVCFDGEYAILPSKSIKPHHVVMTQTISIGVAEVYLASITDDDDDPQCVCGTYRSEHSLCGCPEGFQTQGAWAVEKEWIGYTAQRDSHYDQYRDYD